jgi:hypothetical protein
MHFDEWWGKEGYHKIYHKIAYKDRAKIVWNAAIEKCCEAIRAACGMCMGSGGFEPQDGDASDCPYCGYPIAAIRNLETE